MIELCTFCLPSTFCILANCLIGSQWAMYVPFPRNLEPDSHQQILFLLGLTIIIGPQKTALFFARRQKLKGTAAFFAGLCLILMRWALVGFLVELYGIFILFGDFLGTIAGFARNVPIVGPWIGVAVDRMGLGGGAQLPV